MRKFSHPFRIFISYSRVDRELAGKLVKSLKNGKLDPLWDEDIQAGTRLSEEIKGMIAHSHIFMPLLTDKSQNSPWVHQESGSRSAPPII